MQLGPVFEAETLSRGPLPEDGTIHHVLKGDQQRLYLILVNIGSAPKRVRFPLAGVLRDPPERAAVWFEDRSVPITHNTVQDTIPPLGRRVYEIVPQEGTRGNLPVNAPPQDDRTGRSLPR